ncbi:dimethylarginine dimethylaminohydrolase family protein [Saliterribacillus persicus]|uniref:N-dimethylarginine dimethylaminohydrolase n=1 Tax=Saliterribacillus persicus TaxID=930114 RepID=A0A368X5K2_9BACI|nr:arginine deiminase family protein [Saliterribacillus persicus]RCW62979.1 N-dimethylarginine dimethylaminohydrolase [Saliterribacillus persicus]
MKTEIDKRCQNEYNALREVMVCPPTHMKIGKIINETQKHFSDENIDTNIAMKQHQAFVDVLKKHGATIVEITPEPQMNEQVFTRDIGFCIGENIFIANMARKIREPETEVLKHTLKEKGDSYTELDVFSIEGGDVIVDNKYVWVGISERTTHEAVEVLREFVTDREVIPVPIKKDILHLDCAFNIIGDKQALIYPQAFTSEDLEKINSLYDLIIIPDEEQFTLGTNVFSIGDKKVISLPENKKVNRAIEQRGFEVIEVDFSEIIKSGGSFRCCTFPLVRE